MGPRPFFKYFIAIILNNGLAQETVKGTLPFHCADVSVTSKNYNIGARFHALGILHRCFIFHMKLPLQKPKRMKILRYYNGYIYINK